MDAFVPVDDVRSVTRRVAVALVLVCVVIPMLLATAPTLVRSSVNGEPFGCPFLSSTGEPCGQSETLEG